MLNKQIAERTPTTERTIKFHRAHIMQKMNAKSLADLVRMVEKLGASHLVNKNIPVPKDRDHYCPKIQ
jgi:DNA-binding NarL/FixJ family response regulator